MRDGGMLVLVVSQEARAIEECGLRLSIVVANDVLELFGAKKGARAGACLDSR